MAMFVKGLGYGLMALGWCTSFLAGVMVVVSFGCFLSYVGDKIKPDDGWEDGGEDE